MTQEHVKIGDISPRIQYIADGTQTEFSYPFVVFDDENIKVYLNQDNIATGYNVTGAGLQTGGNVVFDTPPQNGDKITIVRDLTIERLTDFQAGGAFRADVINTELDYITASLQQLSDKISRTSKLAPFASDVDLTMPTPEAGKAVIWNADGSALKNSNYVVDGIMLGAETARDEAVQANLDAQNAKTASQNAQTASENAQSLSETARDEAQSAAASVNMPTAVTQGDFLRQGTSGWEAKSLSEVSTDLEASLAKKDLSNVSTPVDLELKGYFETVNALTAGATVDIDFSLGNIAELTVNQATSLTFSNLPPSGKSGSIQLKLSGGASFAITFPACVSWNGDVPELASTGTTPDIIEFETSDGGTVVNAWLIKEGA